LFEYYAGSINRNFFRLKKTVGNVKKQVYR
jgi:hypothetical protein